MKALHNDRHKLDQSHLSLLSFVTCLPRHPSTFAHRGIIMRGEKRQELYASCYHCGEDCESNSLVSGDKHFCCQGCRTVYELLNHSGLCTYYAIDSNPGISQKTKSREGKFAFLDDTSIREKLLSFSQANQQQVVFYLPQMHCSSCIWLLERLSSLNTGVVRSQVNFLKKEITVSFSATQTSLRKIAETLTAIGYEPHISLGELSGKKIRTYDRTAIYRIGIAGFCFGNIMMLSFPEYFSLGNIEENELKKLFAYLNLALALPVFFYCASGFFISAWKGLRQKFLNIDAPIALAIVIAFTRSIYEILSHTGAGYLDSMSGIVFFMLLGRFFQDKSYQTLSFDRDYTSYFPLGITVVKQDGTEKQIPVSKLKAGDRIRIYSQEIIPADSILFFGKAQIDYSFVTGESIPVEKSIGEIIYAGGRQTAGVIELETVKDVSQSYLTQLWNNDTFKKDHKQKVSFIHSLSRYFTYVLLLIACLTAVYWQVNDPSRTWNAVTAILIVACPCALLLSATFTNGNMLRMLQKAGCYAKNAGAIEQLAEADTIVFDKTGTITRRGDAHIIYEGMELSETEKQWIRSVAGQSSHPLSKAIFSSLPLSKTLPVKNYREEKGRGACGTIKGSSVCLGSSDFILGKRAGVANGSKVYVAINGELLGNFTIRAEFRKGLQHLIKQLKPRYKLSLLSGDNEAEQYRMRTLFGEDSEILFNQEPQQKLDYIHGLQQQNRKVIMIGDGLNDSGALKQSDAGIVVTDDINNFSPACDAILDGKSFGRLDLILSYCKKEKPIILGSFLISLAYNIVGLYYAVQGTLEPVIAAILMPVSSVSIVLFTTSMSTLFARPMRRA